MRLLLHYYAAIYDDSITEALIWCLVKCVLRIKKPVSIIIALEKRSEIVSVLEIYSLIKSILLQDKFHIGAPSTSEPCL